MSAPAEQLSDLLIYHPERRGWPDLRRPYKPGQNVQNSLRLWTGSGGKVPEQALSLGDLCTRAFALWNLGDDPSLAAADRLWQAARGTGGYTLTTENDAGREMVESLAHAATEEATGGVRRQYLKFAWRTLARIAPSTLSEPLSRQLVTAELAVDLASDSGRPELSELFAADVRVIGQAAIAAGEAVAEESDSLQVVTLPQPELPDPGNTVTNPRYL